MSNPLLVFWRQLFGRDDQLSARVRRASSIASGEQASATIFLIMRRMRAPLITLIVIFALSVLGLTLIPGQDGAGQPFRMGFFDAFYFMSYTATTIGFGELPFAFTTAQRMWVTFAIYLTVIGWAYAIGSLLTLLQDRAFREALALQRFTRKVARLRQPFLLMIGFGRTGELLGRSFDELGQQIVVIDESNERIDALDLASYHADVPGLIGDVQNPYHLGVAGLDHPDCAGVLALTDDDEANLSVTMAAALLRPDLQVIARTVSPAIAERMHAFGTPTVINPFDRFGDLLRLGLRAPASFQLMTWLESGPGAALPPRGRPPRDGRWVVCGYGRFGHHLAADLRAEGLQITAIDVLDTGSVDAGGSVARQPVDIVGDASEPDVMARANLADAVGFVAGTNNDTTNLSLVAAARRTNPGIFVVARQNRQANAPLFAAMNIDAMFVPTEVVAHEVYAQVSTPLLWRFLVEMAAKGDDWASQLVDRLVGHCGRHLQALWKVQLTSADAPALVPWLASGEVSIGDLVRSPEDRDRRLRVVPMLMRRGEDAVLTPDDDFVLAEGDEILLAGRAADRRALETILWDDATREYVLFDRHAPSSWIWRKLSRKPLTPSR